VPGLTALEQRGDSVTLGWLLPRPVPGVEVTDYVVDYRQVPHAGAPREWVAYGDGVSKRRTVTIPQLKKDTQYDFRVVAMAGDVASEPIVRRLSTGYIVPAPPTDVSVSLISEAGDATVSWSPSAVDDDADFAYYHYVVEWRETAPDGRPTWGWAGAHVGSYLGTEYTITGLEPERGYEARVTRWADGNGEPSSAVLFGTDPTPTRLLPAQVGWPSAHVLGMTEAVVSWLPPFTDSAYGAATGYQVEYRDPRAPTWEPVPLPDPTSWDTQISGLLPGTYYEVRVTAYNDDGFGEAGVSGWFATDAEPYPDDPGPGPLEPVRGVRVTNVTAGHATVSWAPFTAVPSERLAAYRVEMREAAAGTDSDWGWFWSPEVPATQTSTRLYLSGGRDYQVRVVAMDADHYDVSSPSEVQEFRTPDADLTAPTHLTLLVKNATAALFAWRIPVDVEGAELYGQQFEYRAVGAPDWSVRSIAQNETSYALAGLEPGTEYLVRVRSMWRDGPGPASSEVKFTVTSSDSGSVPVPGGGTPAPQPTPSPGPTPMPAPSDTGPISRVGGLDRYDTAARISAALFKPGVKVAFVATGSGYADALSGAPAAASEDGPMLLVRPGAIPDEVKAELRRLDPSEIVVLGGDGSVSAAVVRDLASYTPGKVTRIGGADRYETSANISAATFEPGVPVTYVATGSDFADALAGAAAAGGRGPVLLAAKGALTAAVRAELDRLDPARIVVLGGDTAVAPEVLVELEQYTDGPVHRHGGANRYETSAKVSSETFAEGTDVAYIATGTNYADALTAAAAADGAGPVLLVSRDVIPAAVKSELRRLNPDRIVVLGGEAAVSDVVSEALDTYVG
jgi:putative cell wall-binding protein